ncbi:MAG: Ig-like domain-containing protein, partial [Clostridiales bacterium]|nr:Ig-like domain-containing protein [Clostridiales bacterium]
STGTGENKGNYYYYNNLTAGTFFRATSGYWNTGSNNLNLTVAQTADYLVNPSGYAADPNISYETRGVGDEYVRLFRQRISYFQLKPAATANIINKGVTQATFALGNSDVYGNVLSDTADIGAHEFNTSLYNQLTTARNALSSAISAQSAYIQSDWSPESWTVYQGLLTAPSAISVKANAILSDGSVSDALIAQTANPASAAVDINKLNDAATTVTNAHNVLVSGIVGAKQLLQAALDALPTNLVDTDYTEATWTVYAEKIADARSVLANSNSIPDVNAATATVKAAGGHLVTRVSVSRPALLAALNALPVRTESEYTAATWAIYYPTVQNAWAVYNNSSATAPQLDAAKDTLVGIDGVLVTKISVARTNLSDAIAALPTLDADLYTPLSWAAYQAVITNAKSVLNNNNSTLAQLEAELPKLASAEDKLETKAHAEQEAFLAAREALRIALAGMPILTPSDYIEASYNEYLAVISAAQAVYDKNGAATLSELQSAKNSLATASNKLVYKLDIAKALLVTTLAGMLVGKDPIDYTESSWADYLAIIADAQAVSDDGNATLSEINDAIYALDHANESLVRNVTIALANLLAALNALLPTPTESLYTADSYAAYTAVVDAAWSEYNKGTASTVEALEAALATLTGVKTLLVTKVSAAKAELAARIAAIKVYNDTVLVKDNYTNDSWTTYLIIITSAEYVRDNGTALEAFEAAIASLDTAESKLETKTAAALKALANALDKLPNLNEGDYTEASWIAYQDIITDAHGYNNGGSTLAELEAAIAALASAKNVLVTKLSVAKIALANALDKLPTLVKADYTNDSWAAYQAIITAAKTVYADVRSTLTAYETATASLATAQSVLTVKEVPPPPIDEVEIPNVTDKITLNRDAEYAMSVDVKAGATIVGYSSSDDKIATVDENGKITAHRKGTATITATDSNGETYILSVTVKFNFWQWLMYIICFGWIWM